MGYPMTFRRFVNRNRLDRGDYHDPGAHAIPVSLGLRSPVTGDSVVEALLPHWRMALEQYETAFKVLLGDLRRLEQDAVDEGATATAIARRTGVDPDVVAVVLKEFVSW